MNHNNVRYDLSDKIIHFFRSVDPNNMDSPPLPEHWGFNSIENWDEPFSPFFMLRNAIRLGCLWATWSERNGRRTIYGRDPVVCFTEMPIAAFIEAGQDRSSHGEHMSPYGLVFNKESLFKKDARPVIYGLSGDVSVKNHPDGSRRILEDQLPLREQFRYVTYNPTGTKPIDWTHEREWRWPLRNAPAIDPEDVPPEIENLHGLELDTGEHRGLGVVVKSALQAEMVVHDILTKVDRGDIEQDQYAFVLPLESVANTSELRDRKSLENAIDHSTVDLSTYYKITEKHSELLLKKFSALADKVEQEGPVPDWGEFGGCWLWITDPEHELTRALLQQDRAHVTREGKYVVDLLEFSDRDLRQRESMTRQLARLVEQEFGVHATYLSVLGHDDPDGVPFYNGDELENRKFYNHSDDKDDF
jgi:hypothetical protein